MIHRSITMLVTAMVLLCAEPSSAGKPRRGRDAPGPGLADCGRVRVFAAPEGMQHDAPKTGAVTINMAPGSTLRVLSWIEDTTGLSQPFDGYQVVLHWNAVPLDDATGQVQYMDNQPGQGSGDTLLLDMTREDWVLADQPVQQFPVFYNETPPGGVLPPSFGLIFVPSAGLPTSLDGRGVLSLCEYELQASKDASGRFQLTHTQAEPPPPPLTQMFRPQGEEYFVHEYQPLIIEIASGPAASNPPSGSIDARQNAEPDGSNPTGLDSVRLLYTAAAEPAEPDDFEITVSGGRAPQIVQSSIDGNAVVLQFDAAIPVGECTTITHLPSGFQTRLGYLPGDVNGDGTSGPLDILVLIDGLNCALEPPLQAWQCDIDRSGACLPADILREIDLLNGADALKPWNGRTLPACP